MEEDNRGVLVFAAHSFLGSRIIKDYKMTQILKLPKILNRSFGRSSAAFPFEGVRDGIVVSSFDKLPHQNAESGFKGLWDLQDLLFRS